MDWRLRIPGGLYRHAREKAGSDADLAALVRSWLERYLDPPQAIGGRARMTTISPERRSEIARMAAKASAVARQRPPAD